MIIWEQWKYPFFICVCLSLTNCVSIAKKSSLSLIPSKGMEDSTYLGKKLWVSTKENSVVSFKFSQAYVYDKDKAKMYLFLHVKNLSAKPVTISAKNVSVVLKKSGKPLRILSYIVERDESIVKRNEKNELNTNESIPAFCPSYFIPFIPDIPEQKELSAYCQIKIQQVRMRKALGQSAESPPFHELLKEKIVLKTGESVRGTVIVETYKLIPGINKNYIVTVKVLEDSHVFSILREPANVSQNKAQ